MNSFNKLQQTSKTNKPNPTDYFINCFALSQLVVLSVVSAPQPHVLSAERIRLLNIHLWEKTIRMK